MLPKIAWPVMHSSGGSSSARAARLAPVTRRSGAQESAAAPAAAPLDRAE
jgi:hypothetical protein